MHELGAGGRVVPDAELQQPVQQLEQRLGERERLGLGQRTGSGPSSGSGSGSSSGGTALDATCQTAETCCESYYNNSFNGADAGIDVHSTCEGIIQAIASSDSECTAVTAEYQEAGATCQ